MSRRCSTARSDEAWVLTPQDEEWPEQLTDLQETAPHCLWVHGPGPLDQLCGPRSVALVGSRASTPYGEDTAATLAAAFAARGGTVVSRGAYRAEEHTSELQS